MDLLTVCRSLCSEEAGQDLIEYTLLLSFVALVAVALMLGTGNSINGIWDEGSEVLRSAKTSAS